MKKIEIYEMITKRIVDSLKKGVVAWRKPWNSVAPQNLITKKAYRGINVWILAANPFQSPFYLSFEQCKKMKGFVKKGEKATPIVYWQILKKEVVNPKTGIAEEKRIPLLKFYNVFSVEQCIFPEDVVIPEPQKNEVGNINLLDKMIADMPNRPAVREKGNRAFYSPVMDEITMPVRDMFKSTAGYYSTILHELSHSTGSKNRLNRTSLTGRHGFGSHEYSIEELIAELSSSFLMGVAGVENEVIENSAAYIDNWVRNLENDHSLIFRASKEAQRSADYIQGKFESKEEGTIIPNQTVLDLELAA